MFTEQIDWLIYAPDCSVFIDHASQSHCNQHGISIILHMGLFFIHWLHWLNCIFLQGVGWFFCGPQEACHTPMERPSSAAQPGNKNAVAHILGYNRDSSPFILVLRLAACNASWGSLAKNSVHPPQCLQDHTVGKLSEEDLCEGCSGQHGSPSILGCVK